MSGTITTKNVPIPVGAIIMSISATPMPGFFICDNSPFDTTEHPRLFEILGRDFLPSIDNRYIRGTTNGSLLPGLLWKNDTTAQARNPWKTANGGNHRHYYGRQGTNKNSGNNLRMGDPNYGGADTTTNGAHSHTISGGDAETHPKHKFLSYQIKNDHYITSWDPITYHHMWYAMDPYQTSMFMNLDSEGTIRDHHNDVAPENPSEITVSYTDLFFSDSHLTARLGPPSTTTDQGSMFIASRIIDGDNFLGVRNYNNQIELHQRWRGTWTYMETVPNTGHEGSLIELETLFGNVRMTVDGVPGAWYNTELSYGKCGIVDRYQIHSSGGDIVLCTDWTLAGGTNADVFIPAEAHPMWNNRDDMETSSTYYDDVLQEVGITQPTTSDEQFIAWGDQTFTDQMITCNIPFTDVGGEASQIMTVRGTSSRNLVGVQNSGGNVHLWERVTGDWNNLDIIDISGAADGQEIGVEVVGDQIRMIVNGSPGVWQTTAITHGYPGFFSRVKTNNTHTRLARMWTFGGGAPSVAYATSDGDITYAQVDDVLPSGIDTEVSMDVNAITYKEHAVLFGNGEHTVNGWYLQFGANDSELILHVGDGGSDTSVTLNLATPLIGNWQRIKVEVTWHGGLNYDFAVSDGTNTASIPMTTMADATENFDICYYQAAPTLGLEAMFMNLDFNGRPIPFNETQVGGANPWQIYYGDDQSVAGWVMGGTGGVIQQLKDFRRNGM